MAAIVTGGPALAQAPIAKAVWTCENGQRFDATYTEESLTLRGAAATYRLPQVRSGSGVRYEAGSIVFHEKAANAVMSFPGGGSVNCTRQSLTRMEAQAPPQGQPPSQTQPGPRETTSFPVSGKSYGGIVRAGPGKSFQRIGSLREGQRVRILSNTGVRWNEYDWFSIRYRGRTGFQWGGLLCSNGERIPGIYKVCE